MTITERRHPGILWYVAMALMFFGIGALWTGDFPRRVGEFAIVAGSSLAALWAVRRRQQ